MGWKKQGRVGLCEVEPCTIPLPPIPSTMLSGTELMSAPATECQLSRIRKVAFMCPEFHVLGTTQKREAMVSQSKSEFWPQ